MTSTRVPVGTLHRVLAITAAALQAVAGLYVATNTITFMFLKWLIDQPEQVSRKAFVETIVGIISRLVVIDDAEPATSE